MPDEILEQVRAAATRRLLFLPHAIQQMSRRERMITTEEIEEVVTTGELVEDYPQDVRGHSCLLLGFAEGGRPIHVVCIPKSHYLAIITAYIPDSSQWSSDSKTRL